MTRPEDDDRPADGVGWPSGDEPRPVVPAEPAAPAEPVPGDSWYDEAAAPPYTEPESGTEDEPLGQEHLPHVPDGAQGYADAPVVEATDSREWYAEDAVAVDTTYEAEEAPAEQVEEQAEQLVEELVEEQGEPLDDEPASEGWPDDGETWREEAEEPAAVAPDEEGGPAPTAPASPYRSARRLLTGLGAAVLVLAVLTGFLVQRSISTRGAGAVEEARSQALSAARSAARVVFSYDYRRLDKDFAAGKAVTTGEFAKEYERTTSKLVEDVAGRYKAVVIAVVSEAGVVRAEEDRVVALVFLNQQSTSSLSSTTKITQSRLEMTLVERDGTWLVERIKAF